MTKDNSRLSDKLIDLELAKRNNKNSKVRRFLPVFVLVASLYYSFVLALGLVLGYLGSKIFYKHLLEKGKVDCVFIDCGKWKFHLHHWIMGASLLLLAWFLDYFYLPRFFVGAILGVIAQDIYEFNDWHRVLVKNDQENS